MTIEQANAYFASLPEGFARPGQTGSPSSAKAGRVIIWALAARLAKPPAAGALRRAVLRAAVSLPATTQAVSRSLPASG